MIYLTNQNILCKLEARWLNSVHIHVLLGPHNASEELALAASTPAVSESTTHKIWVSDLFLTNWRPWHCWGPALNSWDVTELVTLFNKFPSSSLLGSSFLLVHSQSSWSHSCLNLWPLNYIQHLQRTKPLSSSSQSLAQCYLHIGCEITSSRKSKSKV